MHVGNGNTSGLHSSWIVHTCEQEERDSFGKTYWLDIWKLFRSQRSPCGRCRESLSLRRSRGARCHSITGRLLPWLGDWCLWNTEVQSSNKNVVISQCFWLLLRLKMLILHEGGSGPPGWPRWSTPCGTVVVKETSFFQPIAMGPAETISFDYMQE